MKTKNLEIIKKKLPKLLIIGYGRHGKDTVCEMLRDNFHFKFISSSYFAAEHVVYPVLKEQYSYADVAQCYEDRHNHRSEWFDLIKDYNKDNPARLASEIMQDYDIYCGMRNHLELEACKQQGVFDHIIWVDGSNRGLPAEDTSSCTVNIKMADIVISNHGTLSDLEAIVQVQLKATIFN